VVLIRELVIVKKLGIFRPEQSHLAEMVDFYVKDTNKEQPRQHLKPLVESMSVIAFETGDFVSRKKEAKDLKEALGWY